MVSHALKCIFVEIPKTGSSSIRSIIGHSPAPHVNICQIAHDMQRQWTHYGGAWNDIMAGLYLWLPEEWRKARGLAQFQSYFKFSFVRNPWDRVVSLYLRQEGLQMRERMTFDEFVGWIRYSSSTCIHPTPHVNQLDWLVDPHGNLLVDFIGRFEHLEEDWRTVAGKLGVSPLLPHKKRNADKTRHYTDYYSEATKQIIAQKFRTDIDYFGYQFGS